MHERGDIRIDSLDDLCRLDRGALDLEGIKQLGEPNDDADADDSQAPLTDPTRLARLIAQWTRALLPSFSRSLCWKAVNFGYAPLLSRLDERDFVRAAYALMFVLMSWYAQRVFPTPYQWRRVATAAGAAIALLVAGELLDAGLAVALALALAYPLALAVLGFYLPFERARLRRFVPLLR